MAPAQDLIIQSAVSIKVSWAGVKTSLVTGESHTSTPPLMMIRAKQNQPRIKSKAVMDCRSQAYSLSLGWTFPSDCFGQLARLGPTPTSCSAGQVRIYQQSDTSRQANSTINPNTIIEIPRTGTNESIPPPLVPATLSISALCPLSGCLACRVNAVTAPLLTVAPCVAP